jgi:shikimate kinase
LDEANHPAENASTAAAEVRRIVLVGFMGSGKTTLGSLLADELDWSFLDLDDEIERREGRDIPRIFREDGEEAFREIEQRAAGDVLHGDRRVIASGGGWPCRPGRLENLPAGTLSVWLKASPETVLARVRAQGPGRPLLDVENPLERIRELLATREPYYRMARWWVDTELHSPREIVRRMTERLTLNPERPLRI